MTTPGAALPNMTGHRLTLRERLRALLDRRRSPQVLVLVNTVDGPRAVPMPLQVLGG